MKRLSQSILESMMGTFLDLFSNVNDDVISAATQANPWFTSYYIQFSQQAIRNWFVDSRFFSFASQYNIDRDKPAKRVGIIMAGNVPWVGLHDLIMCWVSGNQAIVKPASQDRVLMEWFISSAVSKIPALQSYVQIVDKLPEVDFVLATGSNNSARYFNHHFERTPKVIRHNRFSVAIVDKNTSPKQLREMAKDLFLHNGLGCRNVSNVVISDGINPQEVWKIWEDESLDWLNPLYLKKVQMEKAKLKMNQSDFFSGQSFIVQESSSISSTPMGIFNLIRLENEEKLFALLAEEQDNIQCVVGREVAYGKTQVPDLADFADNVDSLKLLIDL
jgi:hypothetical protein